MDRAELRRLAEAAIKAAQEPEIDVTKTQAYYEALEQFEDFANPATIIELLDEIESLKCCGNIRRVK